MLNNMKISTRLMLLLALLLALLMVIGGVGLYSASKIDSALESAFDEKMVPIMQLNAIAQANLRNHLAIANAAMQPESTAKYIKEVDENKIVIDKQWGLFMALLTDHEDKILAAKIC